MFTDLPSDFAGHTIRVVESETPAGRLTIEINADENESGEVGEPYIIVDGSLAGDAMTAQDVRALVAHLTSAAEWLEEIQSADQGGAQ